MSKWEMVRLIDICDLNMGQSPESTTYNQIALGIPFYQGNADFGDIHPQVKYYCDKPVKTAQSGDILLSVRAPIGALNIATEPCCIGRGLAALTVKDCVDMKYLYYVLRLKNVELNSKGTGSTFKAITKQSLSVLKIPFPPLATQKHIAKALNSITELLNLHKQRLTELDNLIKSVFYDMFGDPVVNDKRWIEKSICDITNVETGSTPRKNINEYYTNGTIPWVKTGEVNGEYIFNAEEFITDKALDESNCKIVPKDSILVAMYGQGITRGKVAILKIRAATNQACAIILPCEKYSTEFLFWLLKLMYNELRNLGRGGNQPNLNLGIIKSFKIMLPPLLLQTKFSAIVEKIELQKSEVKKSIAESQLLFDSLISRYFE